MTLLNRLQEELLSLQGRAVAREKRINDCEVEPTDCYLSVWANNLNTELVKTKIELLKEGGVSDFPALYDLEGNLVSDNLVNTRYGQAFRIDREDGKVEWVSRGLKEKTYERKGYVLGTIKKPAWAKIEGSGTGLAGATSCYVRIYSSDINYAEAEKEGQ